jgi:hypothetical protein
MTKAATVTVTMEEETREAWLLRAVQELAEPLAEAGEDLPEVRVSVGWPGGRSNRNTTVGQCWSTAACADGVSQIFMSPLRGEESTVNVLGTLLHELIHAIDDCESGHRGNFARIAKAVGFVPKLTSSDNRTDELEEVLKELADRLGPFPSAAIMPSLGLVGEKKQGTRQLKVVCPDDGAIVRMTRKWLDEVGAPTCACGAQMEEA